MTITDQTERTIEARLYHDHERDGATIGEAVRSAVTAEAIRLGLNAVAVSATYTRLSVATADQWAEGRLRVRLIGYSPAHKAADANLMFLEAAAVLAVHSVDSTAEVDEIAA